MNSAILHAAKLAAQRTLSRRTFVRNSTSAIVAGATLGNGILRTALAQAPRPRPSDPVPIPGGTPALGGGFHVFAPAAINSVDAEPITISNFNGFVGLAYINGMVKRRRRHTREV